MRRAVLMLGVLLALLLSERGTMVETTAAGDDAASETRLRVKYGNMGHSEDHQFPSSIAFWSGEEMLVLLFRNFSASTDKFSVTPPSGRACLIVALRKKHERGWMDEVTAGTYSPGVVPSAGIIPGGLKLITKAEEGSFFVLPVGTWWRVNQDGSVRDELWVDTSALSFREILKAFENLGTVTLKEVGKQAGMFVTGELRLGEEKGVNFATGSFRVPIVTKPKDFAAER